MPVTDEHIDDLLLRFATLARELGSQLPPPSAPQRLLHELAKVLRELPKADANSHRYALWREIEARVLQVVTPLLEAADAAGEGPEHEEQIYQRCLQHPGFRELHLDRDLFRSRLGQLRLQSRDLGLVRLRDLFRKTQLTQGRIRPIVIRCGAEGDSTTTRRSLGRHHGLGRPWGCRSNHGGLLCQEGFRRLLFSFF